MKPQEVTSTNYRLVPKGIYAITDTTYYTDTQELMRQVEAALKGGIALLQYRNKTASSRQKKEELAALKELCQAYQKPLLVNDSIDLAQKFSLGVHLGQKDDSAQKAREQLGMDAIIGVTCHDSWELVEKNAPFVNYVALGACFPSRTKPEAIVANHALLAKIITACRSQFSSQCVGIGGIHLENAQQVVNLGFDYLACISAIWATPSIEENIRRLTKNFRDF